MSGNVAINGTLRFLVCFFALRVGVQAQGLSSAIRGNISASSLSARRSSSLWPLVYTNPSMLRKFVLSASSSQSTTWIASHRLAFDFDLRTAIAVAPRGREDGARSDASSVGCRCCRACWMLVLAGRWCWLNVGTLAAMLPGVRERLPAMNPW